MQGHRVHLGGHLRESVQLIVDSISSTVYLKITDDFRYFLEVQIKLNHIIESSLFMFCNSQWPEKSGRPSTGDKSHGDHQKTIPTPLLFPGSRRPPWIPLRGMCLKGRNGWEQWLIN